MRPSEDALRVYLSLDLETQLKEEDGDDETSECRKQVAETKGGDSEGKSNR